MGPSGMGKTTLLRIIMNLETKDSGSIRWISQDGSEQEMNPEAEISAMFQEDRLLPFLNAIENVNMMYEKKPSVREISSDLSLILPKKCLRQPTSELSGGMKQRVGIARAYAGNPQVLLMDEPFGALDAQTRYAMQEKILEIWKKEKRTVIFVTNNIEEAIYLADRIILFTKKPAKVKSIIDLSDMERPRDYVSDEFLRRRAMIGEMMDMDLGGKEEQGE